jgi:hypothetical protein
MNLRGKYYESQEFESGQIFVDKSKVWKGLMLTQHMAAEAKYYMEVWRVRESLLSGVIHTYIFTSIFGAIRRHFSGASRLQTHHSF